MMPPAPIVRALPPMVKALAEVLNVSELILQGVSMFGVKRMAPAMMTLAVPSFAGAPSGVQFCDVLQLLSAPRPLQVVCAGAGRTGRNRNVAARRQRVRGRIVIPFGVWSRVGSIGEP